MRAAHLLFLLHPAGGLLLLHHPQCKRQVDGFGQLRLPLDGLQHQRHDGPEVVRVLVRNLVQVHRSLLLLFEFSCVYQINFCSDNFDVVN